jgi:formamidopyrimidine-DNA glycosylase
MLEIEYYRLLADQALGRTVRGIDVLDPHCLHASTTPRSLRRTLVGTRLESTGRVGKRLVLQFSQAALGVRFGMTGVLVLDALPAIDRLYFAPSTLEKWNRFRINFEGGGELSLIDPRRFGRIQLEPDETELGPDAWTLTVSGLRAVLTPRSAPGPALKARLMDQAHVAGLGNLLVDEILWRAALSPVRPCGGLSEGELRTLQRQIRATLDRLFKRGGSHLGDLMDERHPGGHCSKDGAALVRQTVGGRTTFWCPKHQH